MIQSNDENGKKNELEWNKTQAILQYRRNEERHEIAHISNRMSWFLTTESFLLSASVLAQSNDYPNYFGVLATLLLGIFGCYLAKRTTIAVTAAQEIINGWLKYEKHLLSKFQLDDPSLPFSWMRLPRGLHKSTPCDGGKKPSITHDASKNELNDDMDDLSDPLHKNAIKLHIEMPKYIHLLWIGLLFLSIGNAAYRDAGNSWLISILAIVFLIITIGIAVCLYRRLSNESETMLEASRTLNEEVDKKVKCLRDPS